MGSVRPHTIRGAGLCALLMLSLAGAQPIPTPTPTANFSGCGDVCDNRPCLGGYCVAQGPNGCACEGPTLTVTPMPATPTASGGSDHTASSYPSNLTASSGVLFFTADDGQLSQQLWRSDGSADGTRLVKTVRPQASSAAIENLTDVNGTLFFTVDASIRAAAIGTTADAVPFVQTVALWKSDGTEIGTVQLRDFVPLRPTNWADPALLIAGDNILFFIVDDGIHGRELWKSDATIAGTDLVKDIDPGSATGVLSSGFHDLVVMNGVLFFDADDGGGDQGLWRSDGTDAGTMLVKSFPAPGLPFNLTSTDETLYLTFSDYDAGQLQLWRSDGTADGTVLIRTISPGGVHSSATGQLTVVNGTIFFVVSDQGDPGAVLWRSDGNSAAPVGSLSYGPSALFAVDGSLFFVAPYPFIPSLRLWKSDGTAGGTAPIGDIYDTRKGTTDIVNAAAFGLGVVFTTASGGLWRSNGIASGTYPIGRFVAPPGSLQAVNETLFFAADDGRTGVELWRTDGTGAGTMLVKDINTVSVPGPTPPCAGDCRGEHRVTVDDILTGVAIALGTAPLENCAAMDIEGSGVITVDELLEAVNNLLAGCAFGTG